MRTKITELTKLSDLDLHNETLKLAKLERSSEIQIITHLLAIRKIQTHHRLGIHMTTRHEVFERDGFRCTFIGPDGNRCERTSGLQIDHVKMYVDGGTHDISNLRLMCSGHNQMLARDQGWEVPRKHKGVAM